MIKLVILGTGVFLAMLLTMEYLTDLAISLKTENASSATADRFIAAKREGQAIPAESRKDTPRGTAQITEEMCRAKNLHPMDRDRMVGKVTRIVDGDTLKINVEGIDMTIRLWGIDAPEMQQRGGVEAQRNLEKLLPLDSMATVHPLSMDRYGRVIGNVGGDSEWAVNVMMVAQGWAYHYRGFGAEDNRCLAGAERAARGSRMGVWKNGGNGENRPWEHRMRRGGA